MNPGKLIGFGIIIVVIVLALAQSTYVVDPGFRGVLVTLGKVSDEAKPEGFGTKSPFISHLIRVPVRQLTQSVDAECYSSDLQQLTVVLRVLYRIPESAVVKIYKDYAGDPFDSLIAPRVQEALKEMTALQSAEQIVRRREEIKTKTLIAAREKVGNVLVIEDLVVEKGGARVLIDPVSLDFLAGAEIDFTDDLIGQAFKVNNPNATASCGCGTSFTV